jgi:hypothetical protein
LRAQQNKTLRVIILAGVRGTLSKLAVPERGRGHMDKHTRLPLLGTDLAKWLLLSRSPVV